MYLKIRRLPLFIFKNFFFAGILLTIFSCKYFKSEPEDHNEFLSKFIAQAEVINSEKAFPYLDSVLRTIDNPGYEDRYMVAYFKQRMYVSLASHKEEETNLRTALLYTDSMAYWLGLSKVKGKYLNQTAQCYLSKGDVLVKMKHYSAAYKNYFQAKQLLKKIPKSRIRVNFRLADACYKSGKYRQAAALYLEACNDEVIDKGVFMGFVNTQMYLDNAGLSYANAGMLDSAKFYYRKALAYIDKNEATFKYEPYFIKCARAVVYSNLGEIYYTEYDLQKAEFYFKESIRLNAPPRNDQYYQQQTKMSLAMLYLDLNEIKSAEALMQDVATEIRNPLTPYPKLKWDKLQLEYLNQTGQTKKARQLTYIYIKELNEETKEKLEVKNTDLGAEFFNLQKEYEIRLLKKDRQVAILYLIIATIVSLTTLVILFQLYKIWKASKKTNSHLNILNSQLNDKNFELEQTLFALKESQEENRKVMDLIAHDLRSPIGAIVSMAGLIMDSTDIKEDDYNMINLIKNTGKDSLKFIDELLKLKSQQTNIEKENVELSTLLDYCVNITKHKAIEKEQIIECVSDPVYIKINREKIWRVISHLITNAIKFSPNNTTIKLQTSIDEDHVLISVKDEGIGIPLELREAIFEIDDSRKNRVGTTGEQSFGLGLIIAKQIVEEHGGKIFFENNNDKGTTFFVMLPR